MKEGGPLERKVDGVRTGTGRQRKGHGHGTKTVSSL
jgi:hypothetical protein